MAITDRDLTGYPEPENGIVSRGMAALSAGDGINIRLPEWAAAVRLLFSRDDDAAPFIEPRRRSTMPSGGVGETAFEAPGRMEVHHTTADSNNWHSFSTWYCLIPVIGKSPILFVGAATTYAAGDWTLQILSREYVEAIRGL